MTDQEYDVLDELYFVTSFAQLQEEVDMNKDALQETLKTLLEKGWIKCFADASEELSPYEVDMEASFQGYFYLATKAGLLAHNGR